MSELKKMCEEHLQKCKDVINSGPADQEDTLALAEVRRKYNEMLRQLDLLNNIIAFINQ